MVKNFVRYCLNLVYPAFRKLMPFQVFAYLSVGAANTAWNIALFAGFYWSIVQSSGLFLGSFDLRNLAVEIATILSFGLSVLTGFWLSKNFAFTDASNEKKENAKQFGKYLLVSLQGQFSDYLITKALIVFLLMHPTFAYLLSTVIMLVLNFFLQKYYTFKTRKVVKV